MKDIYIDGIEINDIIEFDKKPKRVLCISEMGIVISDESKYMVKPDAISGYRLNDKVLEENGWKHPYENLWTFRNGKVCIELRKDKGTLAIWLDSDNSDCYSDYLFPEPKYVHELQHIYRACKLSELANELTSKYTVKYTLS